MDEVTCSMGCLLSFWASGLLPVSPTHSTRGRNIWGRYEVVRSRLVNMKRSICQRDDQFNEFMLVESGTNGCGYV